MGIGDVVKNLKIKRRETKKKKREVKERTGH